MKFLIFLLKISLLTHYFFATASQIRQYDVISFETPKGASLNNIYGKTFLDSPPTSSITQINVIGPNGMVETVYQNTSMLNTPQDNLCLFRDEPTIKLCESLSCDLCMASKKCGKNYFIFFCDIFTFAQDGVENPANAFLETTEEWHVKKIASQAGFLAII